MDINQQLAQEHSKKNSLLIANEIMKEPEKFNDLLSCIKSTEVIISQRAAMVLSALFDQEPSIVFPYIPHLIDILLKSNQHVAIRRNIIRILQFSSIPEGYQSKLFDYCLNQLQDPKSAIAVKAFSMQVLVNLCLVYPELAQELIPVIELELKLNHSKGVQARGKAMLKKLYSIQ